MDIKAHIIIWKLGDVDFMIRNGVVVADTALSQNIEAGYAQWEIEYNAYQSSIQYRTDRAAEYLPMSEYMDAKAKQTSSDPVVVAEGVQQEADFHAGNLAVKAKYPKPV